MTTVGPGEGIRAREPDESGDATSNDGLRLHWELYEGGSTTIVLLPSNPISHSRLWKGQIHYLARHHRLLVYDGRGNGRSDAPDPSHLWSSEWRASDCLAVMDATRTDAAVLVGLCGEGVWTSVQVANAHPDRVLGLVTLAAGVPLTPNNAMKAAAMPRIDDQLEDPQGWQKYNRPHMRDHQADFLQWWFGELFPEPHSTKQLEDAVAFGLDGPSEVLAMAPDDPFTLADYEAACRNVTCPTLIVHGDRDVCQPIERSHRLAELTRGELVVLSGSGHIPNARHPVAVNRLIHDFARRFDRPTGHRTWTAARFRRPRVLLVSSPIGLGHAWRDVAIARELRRRVDGLEVHWLAQPPVTKLLAACGEYVHPASAALAPEAARVDAESAENGEHTLHAFQMLRRLDEIFVANFMVFQDLVAEEPYDAWIADEAWELDYFLHENPELKTAPYVWLTDFVGVLPMHSGGRHEHDLAADYNAQMVEHVARHPRLRDRSIFIGDPDDLVDAPLGPGLPSIREWTERHFAFAGYVTGFEDDEVAGRNALRAEFGYAPGERVCIVAAGGTTAGGRLLEKSIAAFPDAKRALPDLRMEVIAGPRLDLGGQRAADGLAIHGYVHKLYRRLAACDVAISHGGLSTTMELTALGRPFLYFPLRDHFEQNIHVDHRLARHQAGRRMDYHATTPKDLADAIAAELDRDLAPRPVTRDGAARAAELIAELLPG